MFVAGPYVRGTLGIVWSCFSILLICTWSILHLNVPAQTAPAPASTRRNFSRQMAGFVTKFKWMLLNILAPEVPLGKAWSESRAVKLVQERLEAWSKADGVPWSVAHTYLANMGGFYVRFSLGQSDSVTPGGLPASGDTNGAPLSPRSLVQPWTAARLGPSWSDRHQHRHSLPEPVREGLERRRRHSMLSAQAERWSAGALDWRVDETNAALVARALDTVDKRHFPDPWQLRRFLRGYADWCCNLCVLQGDAWVLDAHQLLLARELGIIDRLPALAPDELGDRNKGDALAKAAALGQMACSR
ncbi:hypothetical protein CDD83_3518 [Cordyceps sp. RAO-2017]|nr:hypothetical protein CDD83_3518 [Cordyceps sp. RAO-2017]